MYPPAEPGALGCEPLKAAVGVAGATVPLANPYAADEQLIDRFITGRRRSGRLRRGDGETVRQFLDHLRRLGTIPLPTQIPDDSPSADVLNRYDRQEDLCLA